MCVSPIVGEWRLVHWKRTGSDGSISYPLGEHASGLIVYLPDGLMMVQMTAANRRGLGTSDPVGGTESERAAAYSTCLAYFGGYEVRNREVIHHIDMSLFPNWSGTTAARPFELRDDRLILRTAPATVDGIATVNEMAWRRVDPAPRTSPGKPSAATD